MKVGFLMKTRWLAFVGVIIILSGCISSKDDFYELTTGRFPGSYRVVFTNELQAVQLQERLVSALLAKHGPDEQTARGGRKTYRKRFWRWRQDDDHLRIDLYIDDLSKQHFEKGNGFRLCLDVVDDVARRIGHGFMNPKPGERRYDVFHDARVMGKWMGWHWGATKKDAIKRVKDPQEFEWELVEDQLAWARMHGMTRRDALMRWEAWRNDNPEWNPYAFSTNRLMVLDGDPGTDDFAAMLILAKEAKRAECFPGVCVATYGNAQCEVTLRNMALSAWYLGASPVLVRGATRPYACGESMPIGFHGNDCLGGVTQGLARRFNMTEERLMRCTHTQDDLLHLIMEADDVTYITTGPLTTLARLLDREPQAASRIKRLYVVGGVLGGAGPLDQPLMQSDERNFRADDEATRRIFASSLDITLFPLNLTRCHARLSHKDIDALESIGRSSVAVSCFRQNLSSNIKASPSVNAAILHDAIPAIYAFHPDKFNVADRYLTVNQGTLSEVKEGRLVHVVTDMGAGVLFSAISNAVRMCFEPK